jgi:hypothetical protein
MVGYLTPTLQENRQGSLGINPKKNRKIRLKKARKGSVGMFRCTCISEVARELTSRKESGDRRLIPSVTRPGVTLAIESGIRASAGLNGTRQPPEIPTTIEAAITIGVADRDEGRCAFATKFGLWFVMAQPLARNYDHLL